MVIFCDLHFFKTADVHCVQFLMSMIVSATKEDEITTSKRTRRKPTLYSESKVISSAVKFDSQDSIRSSQVDEELSPDDGEEENENGEEEENDEGEDDGEEEENGEGEDDGEGKDDSEEEETEDVVHDAIVGGFRIIMHFSNSCDFDAAILLDIRKYFVLCAAQKFKADGLTKLKAQFYLNHTRLADVDVINFNHCGFTEDSVGDYVMHL